MANLTFAMLRLQPDARNSEHVNLGVVALDEQSGRVILKAPDSLSNCKVKNWYPGISPAILSRYLQLMKAKAAQGQYESLEDFAGQYDFGILNLSSASKVRIVESVEETVERLFETRTELRISRGGGTSISATVIKNQLKKKLEQQGLLGVKAEIDPEPVRVSPYEMPAFMQARWLNGVTQYVKVYSSDRPETAGEDAIRNAWEAAKATVQDCVAVKETDSAVSVILQGPESQTVGELAEIITVLENKLSSLGAIIYHPSEMDALVARIGHGRALN